MKQPPPAKNLQSLGNAAGMYQRSVVELTNGLVAIDVKSPSLVINGVLYFRADDVVEAAKFLADSDAERSAEALARRCHPLRKI